MRFRIHYGDGSTWEGDPFEAPRLNVQVIKQEHPNERGYILMHGRDMYCWFGDGFGWQGCDMSGFYDYLMASAGPKCVLFARTVHDEVYRRICAEAVAAPL